MLKRKPDQVLPSERDSRPKQPIYSAPGLASSRTRAHSTLRLLCSKYRARSILKHCLSSKFCGISGSRTSRSRATRSVRVLKPGPNPRIHSDLGPASSQSIAVTRPLRLKLSNARRSRNFVFRRALIIRVLSTYISPESSHPAVHGWILAGRLPVGLARLAPRTSIVVYGCLVRERDWSLLIASTK